MGLFETIRKSRAKTKAEVAAAKKRAKQEAKEEAKLQFKREKLLDKAERRLMKEEKKALKNKRKHERKRAQQELEKIREGKFNRKNVGRYVGALRLAIPVVLPLVYRGITALRDRGLQKKANQVGVTTDQLAQYSGHGAELKARVEGIRNTVDTTSSLPSGFQQDVNDRLDELNSALDNAEYMVPEQRRRAHAAVAGDIESVQAQVQAKIRG
ncbi:DUF6474 family protein [Corynebacterium cystitidis]|uniref:Uncharacterized protein n=1 Tax=Corynebacterium cystitidis DSM 20524 TaxID=1121357 RepID=A0A1H9TF22_9CORY|nr:DUF6474 family protein [Corynebacterium cystitidis]WJY83589.1 hypothetical protein CCYS_13525 [Corynebacterium cystitidis DSM 20524]SER95647.1 hypothetical protein SAMN05661109_01445 [Corynebacterium cystitidis DSM 20524]SNV91875.1 Uncharacterised protein [Corynebacterium cystitidis]